jgi:hypothetical protein
MNPTVNWSEAAGALEIPAAATPRVALLKNDLRFSMYLLTPFLIQDFVVTIDCKPDLSRAE